MRSVPSRSSEASQAARTYSRSPRIPSRSPCSLRTLPNLVASTTSSRRPSIARPTSRSFVNGPYMAAVSRKLTPGEALSLVQLAASGQNRRAHLSHDHLRRHVVARTELGGSAHRLERGVEISEIAVQLRAVTQCRREPRAIAGLLQQGAATLAEGLSGGRIAGQPLDLR